MLRAKCGMRMPVADCENPHQVLNQLKLSALLDFDAPDLVEGHPERMTIRLGDSGNIGSQVHGCSMSISLVLPSVLPHTRHEREIFPVQFHEPTALQWRPLPFACPSFRAFALKKKEMSFGLREIGWRLSPYLINRSMHGICNGVKQDIRRLAADGSSYGCYCEFPTVSPLVNGVRYRFSYGVAVARPSNVANALAKVTEGTGRNSFLATPCPP